jgi:hypothetical protein
MKLCSPVEIEDAGQGFDAERPSIEPLDPVPEGVLASRLAPGDKPSSP